MGVEIRKVLIFSIRTCYRSLCKHPFLVGMVCVLIFLYRSFPFMFSLLVSASPILVCTAILLATLLSLGQPNIPEIEEEEKTTHEIGALKTEFHRDSTVVERDETFVIESYTGENRDVVEKSIEEADMVSHEADKNVGSLAYIAPLIEENSREIQSEKWVIEEGEGNKMKIEMSEEKLGDGVVLENHYSRIPDVEEDENVELQQDKSPEKYIEFHVADRGGDFSQWKRVEEEVDDEASGSGSDLAESSSPDASMADIIPMLDELHPLLDEDAPQPVHLSHDGSDAGSERSQKSRESTDESDEESENQEEEAGDEDDDEEEEETQGSKEDATKSAITWTEVDQKNLMDLGTSELERNQRLENLIARRRARRMMSEKNLIDFESADLPFNIAPISTTRRNPFDSPYPNDNTGLPPIPGSAPSILIPRRNPFDLPYDSSEEKPDLKGDSFQQEFMSVHQKEMLFRRHESFNVRSSFLGPPKQEKQDIRFKPYFVPERVALEGTSYSSFQRQSSELSDSKVSSITETESICSVGDQDDKKLIEEDFSQETELISNVEHPSEHVGHGSETSEDVDVLGPAEKRNNEHGEVESELGVVESHPEMVSSFSKTRDAPSEYHDTAELHLDTRTDGLNCSSRSSSLSLSELHETIFDEKEDGASSSLEPKMGNIVAESGISIQSSLQECDSNVTTVMVDDTVHNEPVPVYDSSPLAVQKSLSSSLISSDLHVETSKMGFEPVLVKRSLSFADRELEVSNQSIEKDTPSNEQILADSSLVHSVDKNELRTNEVTDKVENILSNHGLPGEDQNLDIANAFIVPEFVAEQAPINMKPYSNPEAVEDHLMYLDRSDQHEQDQVPSLSIDTTIDVGVNQVVGQDMFSAASISDYNSAEDLTLSILKEEQSSVVFEQVSAIQPTASSGNESIEEHPTFDKEVALENKQDQVHSSSSDANFHVGVSKEANEELLSTHSDCASEEKPMYELEEQLPSSDKAMVEFSKNHEVLVEPSIIQVESFEEARDVGHLDASEVQAKSKVSSNIYSPSTLDSSHSTSFPSEFSETRSLTGLADHIPVQSFNFPMEAIGSQLHEEGISEEADEIKEIDEGILMELDTVGDFSVKELGSNLNEIDDNLVPGGEMNLVMPLLEARSVEDIDSIFNKTESLPIKTEVEIGKFEIPLQDQIKEEINSGLPVFEAKLLEDIGTSFRQISAKEIKKPVVESPHAELMIPEETNAPKYAISHRDSNCTETEMELPVVEARSIEEIDLAFKQLHNVERHSSPSSADDRPDVVESKDPVKTYSEFHVERASKPSSDDNRPDVVESKDPAEINSDLHVSEARSLEDTDVTLNISSEGNVNKLLKSEFKDGSAGSDSNEVGSSKEIESIIQEHGVLETSTNTAEQPDHGAQTCDDLFSSMSDGKGEKATSQKLSSNSSSSSSSSDSE